MSDFVGWCWFVVVYLSLLDLLKNSFDEILEFSHDHLIFIIFFGESFVLVEKEVKVRDKHALIVCVLKKIKNPHDKGGEGEGR